ncbi:uncharacterized protein LOC135216304 [Macrobrachium nipponense]|uniref:uncharacterized protein LOC135216304 n=1 Tax=Macrobrachium nipponense TaxID=159736 RepID=UPI0030C8BC93
MRCSVLIYLVVSLPTVFSGVSFTFVIFNNHAVNVGETGAVVIAIGSILLAIISWLDLFPINMNTALKNLLDINRKKRDVLLDAFTLLSQNSTLNQVPDVDLALCMRFFTCDLERVARAIDNFPHKWPNAIGDEDDERNTEEELASEPELPLSELHMETVRTLFQGEDPPWELFESGRGLPSIETLSGPVCTEAYRLCPGRASYHIQS